MSSTLSEHVPHKGFTLVDLLVVLLIVGILAGLLFSVSDGIFNRGKRSRAESELTAISVALEAYRARVSDYPDVGTSRQLFDALDGKLGPKGNTLVPPYPPFLEAGNFSIASDESPELLDPWEEPYVYQYLKGEGTHPASSFLTFSAGPDCKASPDGQGSATKNDDNLWPDG
jgi:general secretion pathway protein G